MKRTTIDYGIDLGTTNSAIAVLDGVQTEIIKNNNNVDLTDSAIYYNKKGDAQIGATAKKASGDSDTADDTVLEFKRNMGTDHIYQFPKSKISKRPEELSALILSGT